MGGYGTWGDMGQHPYGKINPIGSTCAFSDIMPLPIAKKKFTTQSTTTSRFLKSKDNVTLQLGIENKRKNIKSNLSTRLDEYSSQSTSGLKLKITKVNRDKMCSVCNNNLPFDNEAGWIQCNNCLKWQHEICANVHGKNTFGYMCVRCDDDDDD